MSFTAHWPKMGPLPKQVAVEMLAAVAAFREQNPAATEAQALRELQIAESRWTRAQNIVEAMERAKAFGRPEPAEETDDDAAAAAAVLEEHAVRRRASRKLKDPGLAAAEQLGAVAVDVVDQVHDDIGGPVRMYVIFGTAEEVAAVAREIPVYFERAK